MYDLNIFEYLCYICYLVDIIARLTFMSDVSSKLREITKAIQRGTWDTELKENT